ncbi:RNA-binding protein [Paraflavisolibacter sp. H34]|uniref:RNA recognition motif domain-containing protein n=1 Tax=Huijunlia imazamoxiresistens TaxID=3127457 RepID=UPI0030174B52
MNIRISNLDPKVTHEQLTALFQQYGPVSAAEVVTDAFTGQPRGFAFVEMPDSTEALNAIDRLNGTELESRALTVAEAPTTERKGSYPVGNSLYKNFGFPGTRLKKKGSKKRY